VELSIVLTDDQEMRQLNCQYRGQDRTTDVLSFSLREGPAVQGQGRSLGDVVISVEQAARQAQQGELEAEILRLLAHGLCHLLGMDHQKLAEAKLMRAEEEKLLGVLGLRPFWSC
jgi:probable rRNA maturation factor